MLMATSSSQRGEKKMDKDSRYNQIQVELAELFKDVPADQMQLVNPLIQRLPLCRSRWKTNTETGQKS